MFNNKIEKMLRGIITSMRPVLDRELRVSVGQARDPGRTERCSSAGTDSGRALAPELSPSGRRGAAGSSEGPGLGVLAPYSGPLTCIIRTVC